MKMRTFLLLLAAGGGLGAPALAQTIDLRMSVKIIVNATTGARPTNITPQTFTNAVAAANAWMSGYRRGYRFRLTEVVEIGGPGQGGASGPSKWFGQNFRGGANFTAFYAEAQTDSRYRLRTDQVNIWVATGFAAPGNAGGAMPIPPAEVATLGGQIYADDGGWWVVHELGHFFGLSHTFAGENDATCTPGNADGIADTLADSTCWTTPDQAAQYHFSQNYGALNASQKMQLDDVYYNVLSYHEAVNKNTVENRLTELQLDRLADHASGDRNAFAGGRTHFVSTSGSIFNAGTSTSPWRHVWQGVGGAAAGGGDIILLRPGNYDEQLTLSKPVTLRAPRTGWVTIGKP